MEITARHTNIREKYPAFFHTYGIFSVNYRNRMNSQYSKKWTRLDYDYHLGYGLTKRDITKISYGISITAIPIIDSTPIKNTALSLWSFLNFLSLIIK